MDTGGGAWIGLLPTGGALARRQWQRRHDGIVRLLAAHLPVLLVVGLFLGQPPGHLLPELLLPVTAVVAARHDRLPRWARSMASSLGLVGCSALLVHLSGGSTEAHFHFFVVVSVVALYEEWPALLATVAFVVAHHLVLGLVDPSLVYGRPDAAQSWGWWFALHAAAIVGQCVVALTHWRVHEQTLGQERRLGRRLLEREAALQTAARQDELLTLTADVAHRVNTPVQYATDNARYLGEAVTELSELAARTAAGLAALPAELVTDDVRRLLELHRRLDEDWSGDALRAALGDCLDGLHEVSQLVLTLQQVTVPAPRHAGRDARQHV